MSIVDELRRMCAVEKDQYEIAGTAYWTDGQLQAVLDRRVSQRLLDAPVEKQATTSETGQWQSLDGQVQVAGTLDAEQARVTSFGALVPGVTICGDGRLTFETDQLSSPLFLTGLVYDLNAAAADVLTDWAAAVKGGYDVTVDGQQMKRSQRHSQLLTQAEAFARKAVAGSVRLRRSDTRLSRRRRWPQ